MIEYLEWDSKFFKKKIGKIDYRSKIQIYFSQLETFELLYVYQSNYDDLKLKGFKKSYQQTCFDFHKTPKRPLNLESEAIFLNSQLRLNSSDFYELAISSGAFSRFKLDENFKVLEFENLYKIWIDNAISGLMADDVICYLEENQLIGFLTYRIEKTFVRICLIAVANEYRGLGIGKQLIQFLESICLKHNINEIWVRTQENNTNACVFYESCGFSILDRFLIKHYWKS